MNKSLVAFIAALIAAAATFSSAAEAGLKIRLGFGGPLPHFMAHGHGSHAKKHYHRKRYIVRRVAKKKVYVAKKTTPSVSRVAKVEKQVSKPQVVATAPVVDEEVDVIADNENSSITSAALEPIEDTAAIEPEATAPVEVKAPAETAKVEAKPEKAASKLDCKKFFPSVGMTLTVPCE